MFLRVALGLVFLLGKMLSCMGRVSKNIKNWKIFNCCRKRKNSNIIINKKKFGGRNERCNEGRNEGCNEGCNERYNDISYLDNITYKDTVAFIPPIMYAKVIKVYDGDTITVAAQLPFIGSPIYRFSVRLAHIDSPEIRGGSKMETRLAIVSRDALHKLIFGKIIELKNNGKEKYGRLLADLYYDGLYINQWMLDNKYAVMYDGGKKIKPVEWD
jgi:endonuclease YncB( thermonuclease family)